MAQQALLYTVPEAARALAVSRSTVYRLIAEGGLETVTIRGKHRIRPRTLERYLDRTETAQRERAVNFS